jgi:hypothetical protein
VLAASGHTTAATPDNASPSSRVHLGAEVASNVMPRRPHQPGELSTLTSSCLLPLQARRFTDVHFVDSLLFESMSEQLS